MFKFLLSSIFFLVVANLGFTAEAATVDTNEIASLIQQKNYAEADRKINEALTTSPNNMLLLFNLGVSHYGEHQFSLAAEAFGKVVVGQSNLKNAAFYYQALAFFNMGNEIKAQEALGKINSDSSFFKMAADLNSAIRSGSDEDLTDAQTAFSDGDYETCLESIKDSLFADRPVGIELAAKCKNEMETEDQYESKPENTDKASSTAKQRENSFSYYLDLSFGPDNNVYLVSSSPTSKYTYQADFGAEYLINSLFDYGVGFNYDYSDYVDVTNEKFTELNLYVPLVFYFDNSDLAFEFYHNGSRDYQTAAYSQSGINMAYSYDVGNFSLVGTLDQSQKKADNVTYNYVEGSYTSIRGDLIYWDKVLKADVYLADFANRSNDIVLAGGTLPYANTAVEAGVFLSYWVSSFFRPSVSYSVTQKNYTNLFSPNGIHREDILDYLKLKLEFKLNRNVRIYFEDQVIRNSSNYNNTQISNKNYDENVVKTGLFLTN